MTHAISPADKKKLRARWTDERTLPFNTDMMRSLPKKPFWSMEKLRSYFDEHVVDGTAFLDLRGFPFFGIQNVEWERVDLRASSFRLDSLPGLMPGGHIGNIRSRFSECLFDSVDAKQSEVCGRFDQCTFDRAKLISMKFVHECRFQDCLFVGADLTRFKCLQTVAFTNCDFTGAKFRSADIRRIFFYDCVFDNGDFNKAGIMNTRFIRCSFKNVSAANIITERVVFEDVEDPPFGPVEGNPLRA